MRYSPEPQDEAACTEKAAAIAIEQYKKTYKHWRYATNEDTTAIAQQAIIAAKEMITKRKEDAFKSYQSQLPLRFQMVRFGDYRASLSEQKRFASFVMDFGTNVMQRIDENTNLILFGPVGTGKSHMAACLGRQAAQLGFGVKWENAKVLSTKFRDIIDSEEAEHTFISRYTSPQVLLLDDVVPNVPLTGFQTDMLFAIVDGRWSANKPTWITANCASGDDAANKIGVSTWDRLRDRAMSFFCNWPSYRKARSE
jgi:DNA replication protein DnaC